MLSLPLSLPPPVLPSSSIPLVGDVSLPPLSIGALTVPPPSPPPPPPVGAASLTEPNSGCFFERRKCLLNDMSPLDGTDADSVGCCVLLRPICTLARPALSARAAGGAGAGAAPAPFNTFVADMLRRRRMDDRDDDRFCSLVMTLPEEGKR